MATDCQKVTPKNDADIGNNIGAAGAASGGSCLPELLRGGRLQCGGVGRTKMPPDNDVILISSDSESSDSETYDGESYDDKSYDDESSDDESSDDESSDNVSSNNASSNNMSKSGPRCLPAPLPIPRIPPFTKLFRSANGPLAACQPGQASAPIYTIRNNTALATDAASLIEHKTARPAYKYQRNPRPFVEPCKTTLNNDNSKCLPYNKGDKHHFRHDVQDPRRAASSQEQTQQKSDSRYRSTSHNHHGNRDQTSSSARRHPPVPDQTGESTRDDPVRLLQIQERQASLSVLPDHQSISKPKPADAYSPSAASKHRVETQHRDHQNDNNQTNDRKRGDSRMPGDRREQGVGSLAVTSQIQESWASISQSSAAMSNNDRVLADVGPSVQPSVWPSASQNRVRLQHSLGRRPSSSTDVAENHSPVEDGAREHGRGDVTQPPPKRRRISPSTSAVETPPKRQANLRHAGSRSQPAQRPTIHQATPHRSQRRIPKPRSAGVASTTKQARREYFDVEDILSVQLRYLVKWKGYGHKHNTWEPVGHFDQCPELLEQFHKRTGSEGEWIVREIQALRPPSMEARRSAV
ncbi:hypothetical protein VTK56DRAFT_6729 [Thermocarpiscus australiensis]